MEDDAVVVTLVVEDDADVVTEADMDDIIPIMTITPIGHMIMRATIVIIYRLKS